MKGAYRMLQKAVRGSTRDVADCRSICDVNRSLLTAETPAHARVIMAELIKHPDVEIKWVKDRINHPTDGGWCDVLFLFSVRGSNGHVCEVQIAFKNMISQRTAGESHAAYAKARDAIETIEAVGSVFVKQANTDAGGVLEENRKLTLLNRELTLHVAELNKQVRLHLFTIDSLKESCDASQREIERLKEENANLRASSGAND
jgi:hypothetical protein